MVWHLAQCGVKDHILYLFEDRKGKRCSSKREFQRLLNDLSIEG
jgi:hypothetical protein